MRLLIIIISIPLLWMLCPAAEASIVNDPVALELKLEEMRQARMAKHDAKEAYWADYRKNHEEYTITRCGKRITSKGVINYCRPDKQYRYTGTMEYPR